MRWLVYPRGTGRDRVAAVWCGSMDGAARQNEEGAEGGVREWERLVLVGLGEGLVPCGACSKLSATFILVYKQASSNNREALTKRRDETTKQHKTPKSVTAD